MVSTAKKFYSRDEYMAGECSHEEYYGKFVTGYLLQVVSDSIGIDRLKASTDEHFNDIPLEEWDKLVPFTGTNSMGHGVCVLKETARQLLEMQPNR